jgi:hypothetical protein
MRRAPAAVLAAALAVALPACTIGVRRAKPSPSRPPSPRVSVSVPACRTTYAPPSPDRPRIALTFDVAADHTHVTGTERVTFRPDRPVTEVVFRLWLNGTGPAANGGRIDVTRTSLPARYEPLGSPNDRPGTLLALTLPAESPAGRAVTADLDFAITLPRSAVDRWGHTDRTAWWGSAHPLLAWVRGAGWARDPAVGLLGETATSDAADYDVSVTAPAADSVLGNALTGTPADAGDGRRRWHFRNDRARDVAVVAGPFALRRSVASRVPVLVAVSDELARGTDAEAVFGPVTTNATDSLLAYVGRFGPYPFDSLTIVALKPIRSAGVEYPGIVFVGSKRYDVVVPHELGHQWFYGLVGDDQARDPWLDEAFATYAEALFNDDADNYLGALSGDGRVGDGMTYWDDHRRDYSRVVYAKGAAALLTARAAAGAAAFDALLRCYVNENAWRVATPADLAKALAPAPDAAAVLRDAGAIA